MLISNSLYSINVFIIIASIATLIFAIINKNKTTCRWIARVSGALIVEQLAIIFLPSLLMLPIGLEVLLFYLGAAIVIVLNLITFAITRVRVKKSKDETKHMAVVVMAIAIIVCPALAIAIPIIDNIIAINSSELVLAYRSSGNGGLGDTDYYAYVIADHSCRQFDLGIDIDGLYLKNYLPSSAKQVSETELSEYRFEQSGYQFSVYKNNEKICTTDNYNHYFNTSLQKAFRLR